MATMADNCISNEIMSYPNFGKSLQRKWIRASNPSAVVIEEPDSKLNFRITEKINDRSLKIKIHAHGKSLSSLFHHQSLNLSNFNFFSLLPTYFSLINALFHVNR